MKAHYGVYDRGQRCASGTWDYYFPPWDEDRMPVLRDEVFVTDGGRSLRVGDPLHITVMMPGEKHNLVGIVQSIADDKVTVKFGPVPGWMGAAMVQL